jgi:TATA-box binding protein (TBP) (component of TFIID and TFIIIB)
MLEGLDDTYFIDAVGASAPSMIYKTIYGTTCLILASGKVVIAGSKSEEQIINTIKELVTLN